MNIKFNLFQDWENNLPKGKFILILFRIANLATINSFFFYALFIYLVFYRFFVEWTLGIELSYKTTLGSQFTLYHGQALIVNGGTIFGDNCIIRNSTTIGIRTNEDGTFSKCPIIGNKVDIGANVCIIGHIKIGDNVKIGAGSIVVKDIPSNSVVVGNPGKVIKTLINI